MQASVHTQVLRRAAEILGGRHQLRAYLRVSTRDLEAWMQGSEKLPTDIFLKVVDVISGRTHAEHFELVRRSRETRLRAEQIVSAAQAAREKTVAIAKRAAEAQERSLEVRAALIESAVTGVARHPQMSVDDFLTKEFALSEGALILGGALNAAANGTGAARGNIQLAYREGLRIVAHLGFKQPFLDFFAIVGPETPSSCGSAHESAQRTIVADVTTDPIFVGTQAGDILQDANVLAVQSTPLTAGSGEVIGMLSTHYEKPHQPSIQELATLDLICQRTSSWLAGHRSPAH